MKAVEVKAGNHRTHEGAILLNDKHPPGHQKCIRRDVVLILPGTYKLNKT